MLYIKRVYITSCMSSHQSLRPHTCSSLPACACVGNSAILWLLLLLDTCQFYLPFCRPALYSFNSESSLPPGH